MTAEQTVAPDRGEPFGRIRARRTITGISAVLLPLDSGGAIDWSAFARGVERTVAAGLTPAVNMDTGYVQLLSGAERRRVLDTTADLVGADFVAGAFVADLPGAPLDVDAHLRAAREVADRGGTPVIFPSYALQAIGEADWVATMAVLGADLDRFIGFELGEMFVPYGRILSLEGYRGLMGIRACVGAKHSSLSRTLEWDRLEVRDELRPDFSVFTGNDLAIDMVMYGSDYLLGLSTFAPEEFALRDRLWAAGDPTFCELNDLLQYLGQFAFRRPVPGYRHDAAMFWELRGWATSSRVPAGAPGRPRSDREVLADILDRLEAFR